jgi:hypothetical protein
VCRHADPGWLVRIVGLLRWIFRFVRGFVWFLRWLVWFFGWVLGFVGWLVRFFRLLGVIFGFFRLRRFLWRLCRHEQSAQLAES